MSFLHVTTSCAVDVGPEHFDRSRIIRGIRLFGRSLMRARRMLRRIVRQLALNHMKDALSTFLRTHPLLTKAAIVAVGAGGGFAYYYFIGCASGTCPITSNPWISTAYGAVIGWIASPGGLSLSNRSKSDT